MSSSRLAGAVFAAVSALTAASGSLALSSCANNSSKSKERNIVIVKEYKDRWFAIDYGDKGNILRAGLLDLEETPDGLDIANLTLQVGKPVLRSTEVPTASEVEKIEGLLHSPERLKLSPEH